MIVVVGDRAAALRVPFGFRARETVEHEHRLDMEATPVIAAIQHGNATIQPMVSGGVLVVDTGSKRSIRALRMYYNGRARQVVDY